MIPRFLWPGYKNLAQYIYYIFSGDLEGKGREGKGIMGGGKGAGMHVCPGFEEDRDSFALAR